MLIAKFFVTVLISDTGSSKEESGATAAPVGYKPLSCKPRASNLQILSPIAILILLKILMTQIQELISLDKTEFLSKTLVPILHSMPSSLVRKSSVNPFGSLRCYKWIAVGRESDTAEIDQDFLTKLTGDPFREYCNETHALSPEYRLTEQIHSFNSQIRSVVNGINKLDLIPGSDMPGTEMIPDAVIGIKSLTSTTTSLRLQVNDMLLSEYHTANGMTKTSFRLNEYQKQRSKQYAKDKRQILDEETSWPVGVIIDAAAGDQRRNALTTRQSGTSYHTSG